MVQVVLFILSVALATVDGWGACTPFTNYAYTGTSMSGPDYQCKMNVVLSYATGSAERPCVSGEMHGCSVSGNAQSSTTIIKSCYYEQSANRVRIDLLQCGNQCEADSVACIGRGAQWDSDSCKCKNCTEPDTTFKESSCAYDAGQGKYLNIVNTITRTNCEVTVKEDKYYSLTCDTTCNENSELTCMGSIDGVTVYLRSCNGKVSKCEADGSCDAAIRKVANGECENPNDPPSPTSSSEAGSSSSEAGSSSGTGEDWEWLKDSLHVIHIEEMETNDYLMNFQPFITGTYDQVTDIAGTAHDINSNILTSFEFLNDIKENTGNTAQNTNNINNKLTNTNQLLTDLNNKSWNVNVRPEITVQGDTNIVNVQTDTAHSGAAILDFLKGIFSGADTTNNYNPNDTAGMGDSSRSMLDGIAGMGDTVPNMHDSLSGAVQSYKARFDSVGAQVGRITGDSLASWNNKLLNNGVLQGNGSNSCPSVLNTPFEVHIGTIDYTTTKTIGMYLCTPISPFNVTLWTLARLILRAVVSIACMWALYRCVLGINED